MVLIDSCNLTVFPHAVGKTDEGGESKCNQRPEGLWFLRDHLVTQPNVRSESGNQDVAYNIRTVFTATSVENPRRNR